MTMNLRNLELFLHLSNSLSFAKTSVACHVVPSRLSRVIQRFEQEVGEPLFERDSRHVRLTDAGKAFLRFAEHTMAGWASFRHSLQNSSTQLEGELSLFCSVTASYSFLDELLGELCHQHPGIEIKLHTGDSAEALERIKAGREDIAIAALPTRVSPVFAVQPLTQTPLVFIAPRKNRLGLPEFRDGRMPDWDGVPLILSERGLVRDRADRWFRERGIKPQIYSQVAGHEAIVSMVGLGLGVGLVPRIVLENSPLADRVQQLPLQHGMAPFSIGLCVLKRKLGNPLIAALWATAASSIRVGKSV
jgi:LysR family positive regulator for ilvC